MGDPTQSNILIVDDDPEIRKIFSSILNTLGFICRTATDGFEALAAVKKQKPDLILLDIMMPHVDGYEVYSQLQANPTTKQIPVVVISAISQEDMRNLAGVARVMPKGSFTLQDLVLYVQVLLNTPSSIEPPEPPSAGSPTSFEDTF